VQALDLYRLAVCGNQLPGLLGIVLQITVIVAGERFAEGVVDKGDRVSVDHFDMQGLIVGHGQRPAHTDIVERRHFHIEQKDFGPVAVGLEGG